MDALKIADQARALLQQKGDEAESYVGHHLEAARAVGLDGAERDWAAMLEALQHLRGKA